MRRYNLVIRFTVPHFAVVLVRIVEGLDHAVTIRDFFHIVPDLFDGQIACEFNQIAEGVLAGDGEVVHILKESFDLEQTDGIK